MRIRIIESDCTCGKNFDFRLKDPSHGHLFVRFRSNARVLTKNGYENAESILNEWNYIRGWLDDECLLVAKR